MDFFYIYMVNISLYIYMVNIGEYEKHTQTITNCHEIDQHMKPENWNKGEPKYWVVYPIVKWVALSN